MTSSNVDTNTMEMIANMGIANMHINTVGTTANMDFINTDINTTKTTINVDINITNCPLGEDYRQGCLALTDRER